MHTGVINHNGIEIDVNFHQDQGEKVKDVSRAREE